MLGTRHYLCPQATADDLAHKYASTLAVSGSKRFDKLRRPPTGFAIQHYAGSGKHTLPPLPVGTRAQEKARRMGSCQPRRYHTTLGAWREFEPRVQCGT